jgi:hypothetical protein
VVAFDPAILANGGIRETAWLEGNGGKDEISVLYQIATFQLLVSRIIILCRVLPPINTHISHRNTPSRGVDVCYCSAPLRRTTWEKAGERLGSG